MLFGGIYYGVIVNTVDLTKLTAFFHGLYSHLL